MSKTIGWIVAIIVIVGAVWYFWSASMTPSSPSTSGTPAAQTTTQGTEASASPSGGSSDADLAQYLNQIDTQTSAAANASASAGQTDQPIQQAQ